MMHLGMIIVHYSTKLCEMGSQTYSSIKNSNCYGYAYAARQIYTVVLYKYIMGHYVPAASFVYVSKIMKLCNTLLLKKTTRHKFMQTAMPYFTV